jgi:methionyl-tRNA formyltransferase
VLAAGLLLETLSKIESGTAVYTEQDDTKATLAPKLKKSDGYIDFGLPAATVRNMIRGFWPWPGASATFVSKTTGKTCRIIFVEAGPVRDAKSPNLPPGTLDEGLNIICGGGALKVARIKPAGGVVMTFEDFVNGYRVAPLDKFIRVEE